MSSRYISIYCLIYGILLSSSSPGISQSGKYYWQQQVRYKMDITMNAETNQFVGQQSIKYTNNSPDVLDKVFFHLFLNAFQPGSAMDIRSRTIPDPDPRIGSRIGKLMADEIGYQRIQKLTMNGADTRFTVEGTILEVELPKPIQPGQSVKFEMDYIAQVPIQIRRNGRDNMEGIRYSMAQWYPKLCEYDNQGWHADPYIGREFYGIWGDFDVSITLDRKYVVAASGVLKNASKIGHGYAPDPARQADQLTWRFIAKNVHDFVWAADPDYIHTVHKCDNGIELHAFYKPHETFSENWEALLPIMEKAIDYANANFGQYPYPVYSFIQAGDGGMEYPMATLITGNRPLNSLVGVSIHELMHSWYQMVLGFDESHYYWMDEGFTDYAETRIINHLKTIGALTGTQGQFLYEGTYKRYASLVDRGIEEPLSTHADHFDYNTAYGISAYVKGAVFLNQLEYVVGKAAFDAGLISFYNAWKFKHPNANDLIRTMEKTTGLELDWYKEYMVYSTKTVDYSVDTVLGTAQESSILLGRKGGMPMPVDVFITLRDGSKLYFTIPLDIMRGAKKEIPFRGATFEVLPDWDWVNPYYAFTIPFPMDQIDAIVIDPSARLADLNKENNSWPYPKKNENEE